MNYKQSIIISLILLFFLSISTASSSEISNYTDDSNFSELNNSSLNQQLTVTEISLKKNKIMESKEDSNESFIYVNNRGNSSSDGRNQNNPTTLSNALNNLENCATIILTCSEEDNEYNITESFSTNQLNADVTSFKITSYENAVLHLFGNITIVINTNRNIEIANITFSRHDETSTPIFKNNGTLILTNCSFYEMNNSYNYGSIYNTNTINIMNSNFYKNSAANQGGILYSENAIANIADCIFEGNYAENGGIISSTNSIINVNNSCFNSNHASFGGIFSIRDNSNLTVNNSTFINNSAVYNGGIVDSWYSTSFFNNSVFLNNSAKYGGVAYCVNNHQTTILNSKLENNTANVNANNVFSYRDNLTVYNNVILNKNDKNSFYCYDSSYNLNNNWWGINNPDFNLLTNNIMPENWRLMMISSENLSSHYNIKVSLKQLSNSGTTDNELYKRRIVFSNNIGQIIETNEISNNVSYMYHGNLEELSVTIDNQKMQINDKLLPYLHLSNITTQINQNVTIKINCNPDIKDNLRLKINDETFSDIHSTNGVVTIPYSFNYTWKLGTYNMSLSLFNNQKYEDMTVYSILELNNNYNNSITLVSKNNMEEDVEENISIPKSFDLNYLTQYQTSIKNQGNSGSCWAFSTLAALESAYLKAYGIEYDFSENNMKNILKKYSLIGDVTQYPNGGTRELEPINYLIGWYGPITENEDPYNDYSIMSPILNNSIKVEDVYFFYRTSNIGKDNKLLKEAILKYGALSSSIFSSYSGSSNKNLYTNQVFSADHAIAIVGWNDFYNNFYGSNRPEGRGAYIIKNSWGESTGENGYQYVSYYDTSLAGVNIDSNYTAYSYAFPVQKYENYTNIYQHDTVSTIIKTLTPSAWVRNVYTAEYDESIGGVGTFIYEDCDYETHIYVNDKLCYIQNGTITQEGYRIIKLKEYISLHKGDVFKVDLKLKAHEGSYTSITFQNTTLYKSVSDLNQSFISTDGKNWEDMYTNPNYPHSAVCLKVYTKQTPSVSSTVNETENYDICSKIININGAGCLTYKIDDEYYTDHYGNVIETYVDHDGEYAISIPNRKISKKEYNITITLKTENYTAEENITLINPSDSNITKKSVQIEINNIKNNTVNKNVTITGKVYCENSVMGDTLLFVKIGEKDYCILSDDEGNFEIKDFMNRSGEYPIKISFIENATHYKGKLENVLTIYKEKTYLTLNEISELYVGEEVNISGKLINSENVGIENENIIIYVNNNYVCNVTTEANGEYNYVYLVEINGTNNITVKYFENEIFSNSNNSTIKDAKIRIVKENTVISINPPNDVKYNTPFKISGTLTDENGNAIQNENLTLTLDGNTVNLITENGTFEYNALVKDLNEKVVTIEYYGSDYYIKSNATITFNVEKQDTLIIIDEIKKASYLDTVNITGMFLNENHQNLINSNLQLNINGITSTIKTDNKGRFNTSFKATTIGTNNLTTSYKGNSKYNKCNRTISFTVDKKDTIIAVMHSNNIKYLDNITITGIFTNNEGSALINSNLQLIINGKSNILKTNNRGEFNFSYRATTIGKNNITVKYNGNTKYNPYNTTITFHVNKKDTTLTLDEFNSVNYNDKIFITGKFTNEDGTALTNSKILVTINNITTTVKTDTKGIFIINHTASKIGNNTITVSYQGNVKYNGCNTTTTYLVNKKDTMITVNPISDTIKGKNVTVTGKLTNADGNRLKNSNVIVYVNGLHHTVKTDNDGIYNYTFKANNIGNITLTVRYNGNEKYNPYSINTTLLVKGN